MAALGVRSLNRLDGVKAQTLARAQALADYATSIGGDIGIAEYGGLRDDALQALLVKWRDDSVAAGGKYYAVAPVGKSAHRTGDAFDVQWNRAPDGYTMDQFQRRLADFAPSIGLRAGYYFHGGPPNKGSDPNHFENAVIEPDEAPIQPVTAEPSGAASPLVIGGLALLAGLLVLRMRR